MKITMLILITAILQVSASSSAQTITLSEKNVSLNKVFEQIRLQSGYDFVITKSVLQKANKVDLDIKDVDVKDALALIFKDQPLDYQITDKLVTVKLKEKSFFQKVMDAVLAVKVQGRIIDEKGEPMPGATIMVKGSNVMVIAGTKGEFTLSADNDQSVLSFSFIGYETKEIQVKDIKTPFVVSLKPSLSNLDQVQVTAYGTTTKRLNAGDITTISADEIAKNPVNNVMEALQGKVPGLFIQQVTGQPGGAFTLGIRESANLTTGATSPLIIVDGVRYPGGTLPLSSNTSYGTQTFLQGGSGLNYINPQDIQSVDILKDVDATAIYGSSGAYGVILITTKKAKSSVQALNANIYTGISVNGEVAPLLNTDQYLMLRREALTNDGLTAPASNNDLNGVWPQDRYTNWQKLYMGSYAATTNANLSYSGGGKNTSYMVSGSLRNTGNIQRHTGSDNDGSLRLSLNTSTDDNKFSLALTGTYLSSLDDMVPYDFSISALTVPNAPSPYNPDGSINWAAIGTDVNSSGVASNITRLYKNVTNNFLANATLVYRPIEKLTLRTIFGYNDLTGKELIGYPLEAFNPTNTAAATQTVGIFHHYDTRAITVSPYAEFNTLLGKKGDLSVKLGGEIDNTVTYYDDITGTGFPSDALLNDPAAGSSVTTSYNLTEYRSIGLYGIIKYVWDKKYILDINTRRDGSTKFGPGNQFGNFGSVAAAWIFSEENFVKNSLPFLSFGKLRASTGVVGGDAIGDFNYLSTYSVIGGTYDSKVGLAPNSLPNPYLKWERNADSEVGLELGFLKDRLSTEFDYYYNKASNQLLSQPLSSVTGYTSYSLNSDAVIRTSGVEASLSSTNIKSKNITWTTRLNITIPSSKLLKLPTSNVSPNYLLNEPVTGIILYKYNGVDPATGYYSFTNAKGVTADYGLSPSLTQADKTEFVNLAPKFYGGLQNSVSYKQLTLDFSFSFTDRIGKNFLGQTPFIFGIYGINGSTEWLRRWQKPGDVTDIPRVTTNLVDGYFRQQLLQSSTGGYSNATYARLQNVGIRYAFKNELLRKLSIKSLTIYLQGQNLLTISKLDGLDPENLAAGVIPPLRVFTGGFNLTL